MRLWTVLIIFALLILTIPWWFAGSSAEVFGLPVWAFYTLCANLVFPFVVLWLMRRHWHLFDSSDEDSTEDER